MRKLTRKQKAYRIAFLAGLGERYWNLNAARAKKRGAKMTARKVNTNAPPS